MPVQLQTKEAGDRVRALTTLMMVMRLVSPLPRGPEGPKVSALACLAARLLQFFHYQLDPAKRRNVALVVFLLHLERGTGDQGNNVQPKIAVTLVWLTCCRLHLQMLARVQYCLCPRNLREV